MTQPSHFFEPQLNGSNENEPGMQMLPPLDLVKPCPDPVPVNVEVAMEWACLGGD